MDRGREGAPCLGATGDGTPHDISRIGITAPLRMRDIEEKK
jgi:hypothetical protein